MRYLVLAAVVACSPGMADERVAGPPVPARVVAPVIAPAAEAKPPSCIDDGKPYAHDKLRERITYLASPELGGRAPGSTGDAAARAYIAARFTCLGLAGVHEQPFVATDNTANVIGYIAGADAKVGSEIIVIGAHHDHIGDKLLGANDNASGVVALLAIAQWIKQQGTAPKRTIGFVTFGAEEQGMVGSTFYAAHAPAALPMTKVVQFINLDMVGSHSSKGFVAAMGTFPRHAARKQLDKLKKTYPKLHVGLGGRASRSDHAPFCERGIPYVFFWTPDARCYHEACDTVDKIDLPRMADIAALAGDLTWSLAQTDVDLVTMRAKLGCGQ